MPPWATDIPPYDEKALVVALMVRSGGPTTASHSDTGSEERVHELFTKMVDDWARFYEDPKPATMQAQDLVSRRRFAIEMVEAKLPPGSKIFDVGCGTGHLAAALTRRGYQTWGT